jgi:hypothetical protein
VPAATPERRRAPRQEFVVPVHIDAVDKPGRVGMACNASATGMLIAIDFERPIAGA